MSESEKRELLVSLKVDPDHVPTKTYPRISRHYTLFDRRNLTAKFLLDTQAVKFNPDEPFVLTSGQTSPVYVDVRKLLGDVDCRAKLTAMATTVIYNHISTANIDVVVGGESAGIPFATMIADRLHK